jgi:hypothetical protein
VSGYWLKVHPEALTRQRIIFVMTGISPKGSTEWLAHVRMVEVLSNISVDSDRLLLGSQRTISKRRDLSRAKAGNFPIAFPIMIRQLLLLETPYGWSII